MVEKNDEVNDMYNNLKLYLDSDDLYVFNNKFELRLYYICLT